MIQAALQRFRRSAPEPSARAVRDDWLEKDSWTVEEEIQVRLLSRIRIGDGPGYHGTSCWTWTRGKNNGYGQITYRGRNHNAHRLSYELFRGPIPDGLQLDHLCRNRSCIYPGHLEPVTSATNIGRSPRALARHCQFGHEFTPENTRRYAGHRYCRTCAAARKYAHRNGLDFEAVARARATGVDLRRTPS